LGAAVSSPLSCMEEVVDPTNSKDGLRQRHPAGLPESGSDGADVDDITLASDTSPERSRRFLSSRDSPASVNSKSHEDHSNDEDIPRSDDDADERAALYTPRKQRSSRNNSDKRDKGSSKESCSDASADEMHAGQGYQGYYESCSEHSDGRSSTRNVVPMLMRSRRTRRQLKDRVDVLVQQLRRRREEFERKHSNLAKTVNQSLRHQWLTQQERIVLKSKQMTAKLQSGKSRAWRHKWVFAFTMMDLQLTTFWLGASPATYYLYFTVQALGVSSFKVFDYGMTANHYFLLDYCFYGNYTILLWLWLMPTSAWAYNAADGVVGIFAISVAAFRNSCVPHDMVRISHAWLHIPPVLVMLSIGCSAEGDHLVGLRNGLAMPWYMRLAQAWAVYLVWAVVYAIIIHGIARKRIRRKNRETLYTYFAYELKVRDKLPKSLRPYSRVVFMLGHQTLFLAGIWWIFLPQVLRIFAVLVMTTIFFHNGGRFYVDHFWKSHERNTLLYVDAAYDAMKKESNDDH